MDLWEGWGVEQTKWLQRMAWGALVSVLVLIFVGATVRVTGAGMGCPDWPKCWGQWVPPTAITDVDFKQLDIEKFQRKAQRMGRAPESISEEILRKEFNPQHVWTEFIKRCFSLPVGFFSVGLVVAAVFARQERGKIMLLSLACLILVLINAIMGARVVYSGLAPGVLTLHMALAFFLIVLLTVVLWIVKGRAWRQDTGAGHQSWLRFGSWALFVAVVVEGVMGSQIREITDSLSKHQSVVREEWVPLLEAESLYLVHRSFSWVIFLLVVVMGWHLRSQRCPIHVSGKWVIGLTFLQMLLGVIMSQVHVYGAVQVLHVGAAAIMVSSCIGWCLSLQNR
jgi:cytochrome c oxidase assembly protein subunit 15